MYRKLVAVVVPATLVVLGLVGCGAGTSVSAQPEPSTTKASGTPSPIAPPPSKPVPPKPSPTRPEQATQLTKPPTGQGMGPAGSTLSTDSSGVALTFDDGPDPLYTPQLLDLLKRNRVKATFCVVGWRADNYPGLVERIAAEGHTLCNHSWSHSTQLGTQDEAEILEELTDTNRAIRRAVPQAKIKYFRAPGGEFTPELVGAARSLGMTSIYWSVDTRDWDMKTYGTGTEMMNHIIDTVTGETTPGAIILAHDLDKPDTIEAFRILVPWLKTTAQFKLIALPTGR